MEHNTAIRLHEVFGTPVFILLSWDTFDAHVPYPKLQIPSAGRTDSSWLTQRRHTHKNISLQLPGERKNYLSKS